mmetsp:Transcript_5892/g.15663  ORF Transcript_5892/g.15663 Transcript_5892/m.15663 type:complete len:256 (+) Transcript_5892:99-866(+)
MASSATAFIGGISASCVNARITQSQTFAATRGAPICDLPTRASSPIARKSGALAYTLRRAAKGDVSMSSPLDDTASSSQSKAVLFVCLGNICRSPTAEAVFRAAVASSPSASSIEIDSCGTGGGSLDWFKPNGVSFHEGGPSDSRMTAAALQRGIELTSRSRPLKPADLERFDVIVAMDDSNVREIARAAAFWGPQYLELAQNKTRTMMQFASDPARHNEPVPDPYYGGKEGFELVLDLLEDACGGLLRHLNTAP